MTSETTAGPKPHMPRVESAHVACTATGLAVDADPAHQGARRGQVRPRRAVRAIPAEPPAVGARAPAGVGAGPRRYAGSRAGHAARDVQTRRRIRPSRPWCSASVSPSIGPQPHPERAEAGGPPAGRDRTGSGAGPIRTSRRSKRPSAPKRWNATMPRWPGCPRTIASSSWRGWSGISTTRTWRRRPDDPRPTPRAWPSRARSSGSRRR